MAAKDYKGFKLALQLRAENLQSKDGQTRGISPYFVVRRAHGKVKTDKGIEEAAIIPDASYKGNTDKASVVYNGNAIRAENTADPKWPKFEVDVESLCEKGDLSKKLVFDFLDNSSNEFLGFLSVSVQDLLLTSHFEISGSKRGQGPASKIVVEHADLIPPSPFTAADTEAAKKICGVFLYQASTGTIIDLGGMNDVDIAGKSAGGWAYYDSVADEKGNITFAVFNKIISACIRTLISAVKSQASDALKGAIKQVLAALNPSLSDSNKSQFADKLQDSQKLFDTIEKSFPLVAKALFRFFDIDGNGTIR